MSGSRFNDVLRGDDTSDNAPPTPGLIKGLDALLAGTSFGGGNVILGGRGSDTIEGRGGDDFIDGDASLTVSLTDTAAGGEITREISSSRFNARSDVDTAVFSDIQANYTYNVTPDDSGIVTVAHLNGTGADGTDTLRHIEQLQFSDTTVLVDGGGKGGNGGPPKPGAGNNLPTGGTAHDTFVFNKPSENDDSVVDAQGSDVAGVGGKPDENAPATVTTPATIASVLSQDATGVSMFDNAGADAGVVDANGENGEDAVALLQPQGPTSLVPTDFHVV